ncbi:Prohibitin-2, subunit of the prohibitin complex (Phb1p-Phb2p) [Desmophyllum pertusum]|uniref:Prohibitin n=1 Tax=Desmophyllum pertusum TaxID=174260 RepID=A0A9W9YDE1_9CNID|nr:Prohibitin-2, subunit of the prohibitin complex (Phb1p-Phb2p) [Desmophyllum pertusum]
MADKFSEFAGRLGKAPKGVGTGVKLLVAAAAAVYGIKESIYTVDGGHRAIIFSRIGGVQDNVYTEGLHFRSKPRKIISPTGSKDLQMVNIGLRVLARPQASMLPDMFRKLGLDFDERVLPSIMNEVLKSVVAQFNASQLITMRQEVNTYNLYIMLIIYECLICNLKSVLLIRRQLTDRAKDFYIILDDVSITDLSFGREYTAAIEAKQVAQQEAQRAQFVVEKAIQERQQKISNPGYLKLRRIRAAQAVSNTMANSQNMVFLDGGALMLNVRDTDDIEEDLGLPSRKK